MRDRDDEPAAGALGAVDDVACGGELDDDIDIEPPYRAPVHKPKLRQQATREKPSADDSSWWMRPDADFAKFADRSHGKGLVIPSANRIIGMSSVF